MIRFLQNSQKLCATYGTGFEKSLKIIQGPSILKVHARQCRVTVLYTFSQEAGVLLFYFKPLVRNYIIFTCLTI